MATQEEKIAIVQRGVNAYAEAEQALEVLKKSFLDLEQVYADGAAAGMLKDGQAHRIINAHARLRGLAGKIAERTYELHERGTKIAKDNDADVAVPDGFIIVMGGGDR
jgi:hypothetical protein